MNPARFRLPLTAYAVSEATRSLAGHGGNWRFPCASFIPFGLKLQSPDMAGCVAADYAPAIPFHGAA